MKKILCLFSSSEAIAINLILFFLILQLELDVVVVRFFYVTYAIRVNWFILYMGILLFGMIVFAIHQLYYKLLCQSHPLFSRNLIFIGIMVFKYAIPTVVLWALSFNNVSILESMSEVYLALKLLVIVSLLSDALIYYWGFNEKAVVLVRIGPWVFDIRCVIFYRILTLATWASLLIAGLKYVDRKMDNLQKIERIHSR